MVQNAGTGNGQSAPRETGNVPVTTAVSSETSPPSAKPNTGKTRRGDAVLTAAEVLIIVENALFRLQRWGPVRVSSWQDAAAGEAGEECQHVAILLPAAIMFCPVCQHLRMRTEVGQNSICQHCQRIPPTLESA